MKKVFLMIFFISLVAPLSIRAYNCIGGMLGAGFISGLVANTVDKRIIKPNFYGFLASSAAYVVLDVTKNSCENLSAKEKVLALGISYLVGTGCGKYINNKLRRWWNHV